MFNMKKVLIYLIAIIGGLSAVIALVLTGAELVIFDESRFHEAYEEYDRYEYIGISQEDLHRVTHDLLEYMKGNREDIVMYADINGEEEMVFEEREQLHMVDVLFLVDIGFKIRNGCALIAVGMILLLLAIDRKNMFKYLARGYLIGFGIFLVLLIVLGAAMIIDFSTLFTKFHLLLFDNDLWLLDPYEDIMIQMFPEQFFNSLGIWIGIYAIGLITIPAIAAIVYLRVKKKRLKKDVV